MIVVCGEALFDVYPGAETPTGIALDARIGGSPLNVAIGLQRLGQTAAFLGGVSRGWLGQRLLRALTDEGVRTDCLQWSDAPTTLSLVGLSAAGLPEYSLYGHGCADRTLSWSALDSFPAQAIALHVGSYTLVVEPVASVLRTLVERAYGHQLIACDVNVRLQVEPDVARWREAVEWMAGHCQLLKLSDEDMDQLYPGQDAAALAARWRDAGVSAVVLTRGAAGARAWTPAGVLQVAPHPVRLVDSVGAGDAFQAAWLAALAEAGALSRTALQTLTAADWQRSLDFAARAAAINCSRRGSDPPRRADLA